MSSFCQRLTISALVLASLAAGAKAQSPQKFVPWAYDYTSTSGTTVLERHQFWEDNTSTAFVLARDVQTFTDQTGSYPELFLFNSAQFDPPDGVPLAPGQLRKIAFSSFTQRGVQLYLNYTKRLITTTGLERYPEPMFFVAVKANYQIDPSLWSANPSLGQDISATRGAFGNVGAQVTRYAIVKPIHEQPSPGFPVDALYITAGVGYPISEFEDPALATELSRDRLLARNVNGGWDDKSSLIPANVLAGNSSGACFADFDGDRDLDLYVGKTGDNYTGGSNVFLKYAPATGFTVSPLPLTQPPGHATWDVVAAQLNPGTGSGFDGYPDIVVANRAPRDGTAAGYAAKDYVLKNDGTGTFTMYPLGNVASDTRSVAVGDLDGDGCPEIVLGNAGSEGYTNDLELAPDEDESIQIFAMSPPGSFTYVDVTNAWFPFPALEKAFSGPLTYQVILADVTRPDLAGTNPDNGPDGKLDLLIVTHRDILQAGPAIGGFAGRVTLLANNFGGATGIPFEQVGTLPAEWATSAALGDFCKGVMDYGGPGPGDDIIAEDGSLDLFVGTGNRFAGTDSRFFQNVGNGTGNDNPYNNNANMAFVQLLTYDPMPGNERGYGFDFADYDADGYLDMVQCSRGYDFLVHSILGGYDDHQNLTASGSPFQISNKRGQLKPQGQEDGEFADFDGDGDLDLLIASQSQPSGTIPGGVAASLCSTVMLLRNMHDPAVPGSLYEFERSLEVLVPYAYNETWYGQTNFHLDDLIDVGNRKAGPMPGIADRVVVGDLDNDGDVDAITHLFNVVPPNLTYTPVFGGTGFPLAHPIEEYTIGWRYLENIKNVPGSTDWFRDVAPTRMLDKPLAQGGRFSGAWNRGLGFDLLCDFDNNGALDLYTTNGNPTSIAPASKTIETVEQTYDLLFLNQGSADWGRLVVAPPDTIPVTMPFDPNNVYFPPETFAAAWGDIDNDGDADVVTTHGLHAPRALPSLLVNLLNDGSGIAFSEQYYGHSAHRVPVAASELDDAVHSMVHPVDPMLLVDDAKVPALFDFDADGDLDLVFQLSKNVPRFFRNKGTDANGDGLITAADDPNGDQLGFFEDFTDELAQWIRPTTGADDMMAVDLDRDGDLDLAVDPFDDEVVFWRNDLDHGDRPAITQAWPRAGRVVGNAITLRGRNFTGARSVELRYAGGVVLSVASPVVVSDEELRFTPPANAPVGLARLRIRRNHPVTGTLQSSTQYFGYCLLAHH